MKKLLFTVSAIAALSLLLVPSSSIAEPTHPNEVGLYTTPDGYGETGIYGLGILLDVYLVLTKPTYTATGTPLSTINIFQCQLNFNPIGNLYRMAAVFPAEFIDCGGNQFIDLGYLEYGICFNNDIPVINESVVLITFTFMHIAPGVIEVTLGPTSNVPHEIPGQMAFQWVEGQFEVMHPISGSHDAPVFLFEGEAVEVENESFGSVKALYR